MLKRDVDLVGSNFDIEIRHPSSNKPTEHMNDFFTSNYYTGIVEDEEGSYALCYFEQMKEPSAQPIVYAQISIKNDLENSMYYIEPLLNNTSEHEPMKYIVYKIDDIESDVISNGLFKYRHILLNLFHF